MRFFVLSLALAASLVAQPVTALFEQKLLAQIADYDARMDGVLGVAVVDLATGKRVSYHGDTVFPQASTIKVPILIEVFRLKEAGKFDMAEKVTLTPKDSVAGSGVLQTRLKNGPITVTLGEIVREMIVSSDNTATNVLIQRLGMANINATMLRLGFPQTRVGRIMLDQAAASRNEENLSTPKEMAEIMAALYQTRLLSPQSTAEMIAILKQVKDDMRKGVPAEIEVASKPGELTGVRCEAGIVYLKSRPFVVVIMSTYLTEPKSPIEDLTRLVFRYFEKLEKGNQYGNLGVR